ncbi:MAG: exodeoxyribonuclease VII small subunit [Lachnospiraceae bacterium]|jgi:exodeoxyribonuclease VII small subunit|nr:exodeoxyribonuclease VII small subunit [Lachnospiraceae bacterium]MBR6398131.1 exodeoxyribonuclease VII small subunit [Lachnospiraceae bacterium]MBR7014920.1 exodeoxyribonuclease VII small subunit [Lachnospiraceae bacterium]MEE1109464.1 exodeoxyribonuclease VII small subunit [Lachnospiraceae bacterium]MEE3437042.1 exodeoxyribonuclease VII small subunit [Lachnospiraceae bacterium]
MDEKKEMTIEESFAALDDMVKKLESDKISLEESFRLYEEGMKLVKDVSGRIELVEKKMQIIAGNGETEDFE